MVTVGGQAVVLIMFTVAVIAFINECFDAWCGFYARFFQKTKRAQWCLFHKTIWKP